MKTAIITGACSAMGIAVQRVLRAEGYILLPWCRCIEIDLSKPETIPPTDVDLVVHIAETGATGLDNLWKATSAALIGNSGALIGFSSVHHLKHDDAYARSKKTQEAFLLSYARHHSVRVNCLRLGHIAGTQTWPTENTLRLPEIPAGRFGTVEDVAQAVQFIVNAPWMNGSVLTLDGGMSLL